MNQQQIKRSYTPQIVLFALLLYILPWVMNPGFTLSLGAYDFAELLAKRSFAINDKTYLTMLALRGELLILTAIVAFSTHRPYFTIHWWTRAIFCLILVIAQLPPLTFIANTGDINQQQQLLLTIGSVIIASIGLSGIVWRWRYLIGLVLGIIGVASVIYSLINGTDMMNDYGVPAYIGFGGVGMVIFYSIVIIGCLFKIAGKQTEPHYR